MSHESIVTFRYDRCRSYPNFTFTQLTYWSEFLSFEKCHCIELSKVQQVWCRSCKLPLIRIKPLSFATYYWLVRYVRGLVSSDVLLKIFVANGYIARTAPNPQCTAVWKCCLVPYRILVGTAYMPNRPNWNTLALVNSKIIWAAKNGNWCVFLILLDLNINDLKIISWNFQYVMFYIV